MLGVSELCARFGPVVAVRSVDLEVPHAGIVAVVGPNSAGKTTLLRAVMGLHSDISGTVSIDGRALPPGAVAAARRGLAIVPQGRRLFRTLSVSEHLMIARAQCRGVAMTTDDLFSFFPGLAKRLDVRAGNLSGGEQQMLAIARAVLTGPRFVLMDEPTEGLAPSIVSNVVAMIDELPSHGIGVLVADQHDGPFARTVRVVHRMERGELVGGAAPDAHQNDPVDGPAPVDRDVRRDEVNLT